MQIEENKIEKMRKLRDKRNLEIIKENKNIITENEIKDVIYLGKLSDDKDIYLLIEQIVNERGDLVEVEKYCTEDGEVLGGNNKSDSFDFILLNEKNKDNKELLRELEKLDGNRIYNLNKIEKERLEKIEDVLEIDIKDIKGLSEIDDKELEKAEEKLNNNKTQEYKTITKKELEGIPVKAEIDINEKVTDNDTIASLLKIQDKGYVKIAVIYSEKMSEKNNTTTFSFVGIKSDGSVEKIDNIEQVEGNYPKTKVYEIKEDGSKIEQKQMNSIYRIKGSGEEKQIAARIGEYGTIETSLLRESRNNKEALAAPIRNNYDSIPTSRDVSRIMTSEKNIHVEDEIEKIKEEKTTKIDNIKDNNNEMIINNEEYLNKIANEIIENEKIASVYNREDVKNRLIKTIKENKNISNKEIRQEVEIQMEEEAEEEHETPQPYSRLEL